MISSCSTQGSVIPARFCVVRTESPSSEQFVLVGSAQMMTQYLPIIVSKGRRSRQKRGISFGILSTPPTVLFHGALFSLNSTLRIDSCLVEVRTTSLPDPRVTTSGMYTYAYASLIVLCLNQTLYAGLLQLRFNLTGAHLVPRGKLHAYASNLQDMPWSSLVAPIFMARRKECAAGPNSSN